MGISDISRLEIPDREKRGIERKGNFIINLRCYKLFHCTVGHMDRLSCVLSMALPSFILPSLNQTLHTCHPSELWKIGPIDFQGNLNIIILKNKF